MKKTTKENKMEKLIFTALAALAITATAAKAEDHTAMVQKYTGMATYGAQLARSCQVEVRINNQIGESCLKLKAVNEKIVPANEGLLEVWSELPATVSAWDLDEMIDANDTFTRELRKAGAMLSLL